jgi:predicted acylesterase/phospholipase RssA
MTPTVKDSTLRENIGIAVDGGGIRGAIVARGLIELEDILGVDRLVDSPRVKVVAGTSTGSLIAASIAAGLSAAEILQFYQDAEEYAFSRPGPVRPFGCIIPLLSQLRVPARVPRWLDKIPGIGELLVYALFPVRYSFDPLRAKLYGVLRQHPCPTADPTIGELGSHLRPGGQDGLTLIITAVDVARQRTHFIKTSPTETAFQQQIKVVDALLASSCIPTYYPPVALPTGNDTSGWFVDGGVGNFGNPALVVAWELCDELNPDPARGYDPATVTVFSFGTGVPAQAVNERIYGTVNQWWALDWIPRVLDIFMASAIRQQSRNIITTYKGIDLRRFQLELPDYIEADDFDVLDTVLKAKGEELRVRIRHNQHALSDPGGTYDPEHILDIIPLN